METTWRQEYQRAVSVTDSAERIDNIIEAEEHMQRRLLELTNRQECVEYKSLTDALRNLLILKAIHLPSEKYAH